MHFGVVIELIQKSGQCCYEALKLRFIPCHCISCTPVCRALHPLWVVGRRCTMHVATVTMSSQKTCSPSTWTPQRPPWLEGLLYGCGASCHLGSFLATAILSVWLVFVVSGAVHLSSLNLFLTLYLPCSLHYVLPIPVPLCPRCYTIACTSVGWMEQLPPRCV